MWDTQWAEALAGRVRSGKSVRMCCGKWAMLSWGLRPTPPGFEHAQPCHFFQCPRELWRGAGYFRCCPSVSWSVSEGGLENERIHMSVWGLMCVCSYVVTLLGACSPSACQKRIAQVFILSAFWTGWRVVCGSGQCWCWCPVIPSDLLTCPEMLPCSHWMRSQALDCVGGKAEFLFSLERLKAEAVEGGL